MEGASIIHSSLQEHMRLKMVSLGFRRGNRGFRGT